jgi:hypothetical protein
MGLKTNQLAPNFQSMGTIACVAVLPFPHDVKAGDWWEDVVGVLLQSLFPFGTDE